MRCQKLHIVPRTVTSVIQPLAPALSIAAKIILFESEFKDRSCAPLARRPALCGAADPAGAAAAPALRVHEQLVLIAAGAESPHLPFATTPTARSLASLSLEHHVRTVYIQHILSGALFPGTSLNFI